MELSTRIEQWELRKPFTITRGTFTSSEVLVAEIRDGQWLARAEAAGVDYHGENRQQMAEQIEAAWFELGDEPKREALQEILPPGGARNALDCALWDLEAKRSGRSIWELVDLKPRNLTTVCTIGIDEPESMAASAAEMTQYPELKIKLNDDRPVERIEAIRQARPDARLVIDANQAWTLPRLREVAPHLAKLGVEMIEQPLAEGGDAELQGYEPPVLLCADESCNTLEDLEYLATRYQMVNIKLDKTGGLTEALRIARRARDLGLELMIGNMLGSSLAMAPAFVIGLLCRYNDLDGPLLQKRDRENGMAYDGGTVSPPRAELWG
jgi:L-alanine-DL-glutamate epimerase-like enolase superfamily enzyme